MRVLFDLIPGESMDITFPEGFVVRYMRRFWNGSRIVEEETNSILAKMTAYYWDDDDHRCLDFYFHKQSGDQWFAKWHDLTKESQDKVREFIRKYFNK